LDFYLVIERGQARNVDDDMLRQLGRVHFHLELVHDLGQNTAEVLDRGRRALKLEGYRNGHRLALLDGVEIGVNGIASDGIHRNVVDERLLLLREARDGDDRGLARLAEELLEHLAIDGDGGRLGLAAVHDRGQNALAAKGFGAFGGVALLDGQFHNGRTLPNLDRKRNPISPRTLSSCRRGMRPSWPRPAPKICTAWFPASCRASP